MFTNVILHRKHINYGGFKFQRRLITKLREYLFIITFKKYEIVLTSFHCPQIFLVHRCSQILVVLSFVCVQTSSVICVLYRITSVTSNKISTPVNTPETHSIRCEVKVVCLYALPTLCAKLASTVFVRSCCGTNAICHNSVLGL